MNHKIIKLTLLNNFFSYTILTSRGALTLPFLGDLALTYALNNVLKTINFYEKYKLKPNYKEIKKLPYYITIGRPINYEFTQVYIRNTQFVDGYPLIKEIEKSGQNLYKNLFKVQGIKAGSQFISVIFYQDNYKIKLPSTVRLGTSRECLVKIEEEKDKKEEKVWLNIYTLKNVFNTFEKIIKFVNSYNIEYIVKNYIIWKDIPISEVILW